MTYRLNALLSSVNLAPILGGLQWKVFALDFFQRCRLLCTSLIGLSHILHDVQLTPDINMSYPSVF